MMKLISCLENVNKVLRETISGSIHDVSIIDKPIILSEIIGSPHYILQQVFRMIIQTLSHDYRC